MKKGLKVFLTAAIVLSAVACSTTNDEETKTKETKEKIVEQRKIQVCQKSIVMHCIRLKITVK